MSQRINWGYTNLDKFDNLVGSKDNHLKKYLNNSYPDDGDVQKVIKAIVEDGELSPKDEEEAVLYHEALVGLLDYKGLSKDVMTDLIAEDLEIFVDFISTNLPESQALGWLYTLYLGVNLGKFGDEIEPIDYPILTVSESKEANQFLVEINKLKEEIENSKLKKEFKSNKRIPNFLDELIEFLENSKKQKKYRDVYIWLG